VKKIILFCLFFIGNAFAYTNDIQDTQTAKKQLKATYMGATPGVVKAAAGTGILSSGATLTGMSNVETDTLKIWHKSKDTTNKNAVLKTDASGWHTKCTHLLDTNYDSIGRIHIRDTITRIKDTISRRVKDSLDALRSNWVPSYADSSGGSARLGGYGKSFFDTVGNGALNAAIGAKRDTSSHNFWVDSANKAAKVTGSMTSAEFGTVCSDETGTGSMVFSVNPILTTPNIGAANGYSLSLDRNSGLMQLITLTGGSTSTKGAMYIGCDTAKNWGYIQGVNSGDLALQPDGGAVKIKGALHDSSYITAKDSVVSPRFKGKADVADSVVHPVDSARNINKKQNTFALNGFVSPETNSHQGYATDGTYHYLIHTTSLKKCNDDAGWTTAATNATPFSGLSGYDHLGDGSCYNGHLYVVGETYSNCTFSNQSIFVFHTLDLTRDSVHDISAQNHEASGLAIDTVNSIIYVCSYCDGSMLWKYSLGTMAYVGTVILRNSNIYHIQGIAFRNNLIYVSQDNGCIFTVTLNGTKDTGYTKIVWSNSFADSTAFVSFEGIDYTQNTLRILMLNAAASSKVKYFDSTICNVVDVKNIDNDSADGFHGLRLNLPIFINGTLWVFGDIRGTRRTYLSDSTTISAPLSIGRTSALTNLSVLGASAFNGSIGLTSTNANYSNRLLIRQNDVTRWAIISGDGVNSGRYILERYNAAGTFIEQAFYGDSSGNFYITSPKTLTVARVIGLADTATAADRARTVTTNANLTGPITSVGNATTIAASPTIPIAVNISSGSWAAPASGANLELNYRSASDDAHIDAYNRTTHAYKTLNLGGLNMRIYTDSIGGGVYINKGLFVTGTVTSAKDSTAYIADMGAFGCNGSTPQTKKTVPAAVVPVSTTASTQLTPWGFSRQAQADSIITIINNLTTLVDSLRAALVNNGIAQ
jgi:hypothetical protein